MQQDERLTSLILNHLDRRLGLASPFERAHFEAEEGDDDLTED